MRIDPDRTLLRLIQEVRRMRDRSWDSASRRHRLTLREAIEVVVSKEDYWPFVGEAALGAKSARHEGGRKPASGDNQHRL